MAQPTLPAAEYWTRLNYGLTATRKMSVCIAEGYASHIFHLQLPREMEMTNETFECDTRCRELGRVPAALESLRRSVRTSIIELITEIYELLPDIAESGATDGRFPRNRGTRGLVDAVGEAYKFLFGVSTEADTNALRQDMTAIKALIRASASDAERTRQGMASYTKLTNDRLDALH